MHKQNNQLIHPLSPENINNIVSLCSKFIRERYNVSLATSTLYEILTNIYKSKYDIMANSRLTNLAGSRQTLQMSKEGKRYMVLDELESVELKTRL